MPNRTPAPDDLPRLFRDVVLVLGGVFAVEGTDDRTIRRVAAGLRRVYERMRPAAAPNRKPPTFAPHPEMARLLCLTESRADEP